MAKDKGEVEYQGQHGSSRSCATRPEEAGEAQAPTSARQKWAAPGTGRTSLRFLGGT